MPRYMLVLSEDPSQYRDVSPADMQAILEKYGAWSQALVARGAHLGGEKLTDEGGRRMRRQQGKVVVVDGPYAEAREVVGGYFLIQAKDYDEAVAIARDCPHLEFGGTIDVRQVDEIRG
jgi:hypothetical protein